MSSLYELTSERLALQNTLQSLDMDAQTIEDTLEGDSQALQVKIENYGYVIRNMESFAEAIKAEEDRLSKRRRIQENRVEQIKNWLKLNMEACGIQKIECPAFTIAVQNNPASVVIDTEYLIPAEYMCQPEPPPPAPNKAAIKDAIKSGIEVPGAHLSQSTRIVIK